jgi:hypothetical protein
MSNGPEASSYQLSTGLTNRLVPNFAEYGPISTLSHELLSFIVIERVVSCFGDMAWFRSSVKRA